MNATVLPQSVNGGAAKLQYLTLYPNGQVRPLASTLNSTDGSVVSNMAIVPAGQSGVCRFVRNGPNAPDYGHLRILCSVK